VIPIIDDFKSYWHKDLAAQIFKIIVGLSVVTSLSRLGGDKSRGHWDN
jgi:hypothetical protein